MYSPPHNFIIYSTNNNLQHCKAFSCNRKRPSTVNKHCRSVQCSCSKQHQESKFSCLVVVRLEKRFGDGNVSGENWGNILYCAAFGAGLQI